MRNNIFPYAQLRFADIQLLRYRVPAFQDLSLRQKQYVYHLAEAALCGRDILWDQNCRHNLAIRRLLEDILQNSAVVHEGKDWEAFITYLRQVWFANGIHHHYSTDKFRLLSLPSGLARHTVPFPRPWLGPRSSSALPMLSPTPPSCPSVCARAATTSCLPPHATTMARVSHSTRQSSSMPSRRLPLPCPTSQSCTA